MKMSIGAEGSRTRKERDTMFGLRLRIISALRLLREMLMSYCTFCTCTIFLPSLQ